ncbi:glycoside hydrolase family 2 TIM barrel-domain containing protein [Flavihumibacter stibioxidans]|uniref:Glycosyl hydrolase n=1 Tax=Flavihumibacter stibioxidans TaxID=1834163 RepID=A0ABR7MAZ9_9BACT|nr:glycoside hydrolase family 2 TIM barrel-domain containing protein [Flavihumibacter stibioxidans]MBC6491905.1 glycosyl hydrolase [Flavihumibacter stibioxidans]
MIKHIYHHHPFACLLIGALLTLIHITAYTQQRYELNSGWRCINVKNTTANGNAISQPSYPLKGWMPATVPGTVLTTLLNNQQIPDPFYGMNNEKIPDIYHTGNDQYTYWFVKDFKETVLPQEQAWLQLRGVNYKSEIYLNGKKINPRTHEGMFLRQQYNITPFLAKNGTNRLAVIVYPPDHPGNPNGGQGGDGTIAKGLTHQYVAGWDWIQPIRDRNTGIWDKVFIEKTGGINVQNPHIVTEVKGKRYPGASQEPAVIRVSAELENPTPGEVSGILQYQLEGKTISKQVTIPANSRQEIRLPDLKLDNPRLWWPNGYGAQELYDIKLQFLQGTASHDEETIRFGIRQIDNSWNPQTGSMQAFVNGQPIFIKGGNWIISDAMLRFSEERYDAEVRFHRDMNLNLIRIWGGALTERPEFYQACDKYGMLVFQDFWFSGDCNGRWLDPMKKEDQWTRRKYPDDHPLVVRAIADQVRMIRNHPSLAFWCGGNEITPPEDILHAIKDSLLPALDGTRYFFDYSNSDSMSLNTIGGNGDGPYNIQDINSFWTHKTFPYNSEIGSVGVGDYASLKRFIPAGNMTPPQHRGKIDSVWQYHKYIGYGEHIDKYGPATDAEDFAMKAQLVNYDQYRALAEGFSSHMWHWYTGVMIWKTQNPWTALRGQMYDYYLDPNACLYGLRKGSEPLHIMMNPADSMVMIVNNGFTTRRDLMMEARVYDVLTGRDSLYTLIFNEIGPSMAKKYFPMNGFLKSLHKQSGVFVSLKLKGTDKTLISENLYWLPGADGKYKALQEMPAGRLQVSATHTGRGRVTITLSNPETAPVSFFNRLALIHAGSGERILPAFYSDNYLSILPGERTTIVADYPETFTGKDIRLEYYGWNQERQVIGIQK